MKLHENNQEFIDIVSIVSSRSNIDPAIIEKDYYVTILLMELCNKIPGLLFKGGTSLSKCHKVINRFSEDIDLTLDKDHFTQGKRRGVKYSLIDVCEKLGLEVLNADNANSRMEYNRYEIRYPKLFIASEIKPNIIAETVFIQKAYPSEIKQATSIIYDYLTEDERNDLVKDYKELMPFDIRVQTLDRTFIDKVFALCDYMMRKEIKRNSRHIYDLYCILPHIEIEALKALVCSVREDRKKSRLCLSAQDGVDVGSVLQEIIDSNIYKSDYESITEPMSYKPIPYDTAIGVIKTIIESKIFS